MSDAQLDFSPIIMPKLGSSMTAGIISEWLISPGEAVVMGQEIASIETDKAVAELEAPASGVVLAVISAVGSSVDVGHLIAVIGPSSSSPVEVKAFIDGFRPETRRF